MKALILNSGMGTRMGEITAGQAKCMIRFDGKTPLVAHQIKTLMQTGIDRIVMTTGYMHDDLVKYLLANFPMVDFSFVENKEYRSTNYIYSVFLALDELQDDVVLVHGDLYFTYDLLQGMLEQEKSVVATEQVASSKDFEAETRDGRITEISTKIATGLSVWPLYKLNYAGWSVWSAEIKRMVKIGTRDVYAEEAFNRVAADIALYRYDIGGTVCMEVDTPQDIERLREKL